MVLPLVGMADFSPLGQTTPFTYRDTDTNMSMVRGLRAKLDELIEAVNSANDVNTSEHNRIVRDLTAQFNNALTALESELSQQIDGLGLDGVSAFDPTTGKRQTDLSRVVGNTFDNARVFAYFAKQLDDYGWTAAQYDAHQDTARHFDLAPTYPVLNDVLPS